MIKYLHEDSHRLQSQVQITEDIPESETKLSPRLGDNVASGRPWKYTKSSLNVLLGIQCPLSISTDAE